MIRNRLWAIVLPLFAAACTRDGSPADVEIFQAIVQSEACDVGQYGKYNVVSDRPASLQQHPPVLHAWSKWLPDPQVRSASLARAEQRRKWPLLTPCGAAVRVVDGSFVEGIFDRETTRPRSWQGFYAAFPVSMGLFKISAPVLDADGNAALVHVERTCDVLCGTGWLVELRKEQGRWRVVRREGLWIS
jgi:hypothetical protein